MVQFINVLSGTIQGITSSPVVVTIDAFASEPIFSAWPSGVTVATSVAFLDASAFSFATYIAFLSSSPAILFRPVFAEVSVDPESIHITSAAASGKSVVWMLILCMHV